MLFNSIDFAIFLPIVFLFYWWVFKNSLRLQNALIVVSSYLFYGWWDWRFLSLIIFSTLADYLIGRRMGVVKDSVQRKRLLWLSISINLGFLGFFKYFNFFLDTFQSAFSFAGFEVGGTMLNVVLPVGISFYTFQTLSYTIDVYRGKLQPTSDFISFSAFVSFFPQLVAGPIERATHLLPQFGRQRVFNYSLAVNGMRQILWGFFKKLVIADTCAIYANQIFNSSEGYGGSALFLGGVFFAFQIYGDFSGYSDIAIGVSRLFGFDLMRNFAFPYFSRDIAEFWRRWHISLSTWFRDYLYIPLGGSKGTKLRQVRNVFVIFVVSGFWHGANWTFIFWGVLNALYFIPLLLLNRNRSNLEIAGGNRHLPSLREFVQILSTFFLATIAWISFRAEDIHHAIEIYQAIFSKTLFSIPQGLFSPKMFVAVLLIAGFVIVEWIGRRRQFAIECLFESYPRVARWGAYTFIIFLIGMFMETKESPFIYFQF
ncbi:acyltransferase [Roseivirga sp. 4D4]|uniref:MBOAT family O-acyltransferase n=1 Tax=Roseivirga sp. 4D4 TaxID=1889784 RepID=UPI00085311A3|nr:MBOAT family O-acyltransferase [Roseivirga sp. 4D4]OEK01625.1 acyltransferase [Roseivirga sp. 4D4]